jgi:hypothetical protein
MKYLFFILLTTLISCRQPGDQIIYSTYKNKPTNNVRVGERFQLIFGSNSCCLNGQLDKSTLRSLEYLKDSVVLPSPEDCDGCTTYYAVIFKAVKSGKDSVRFILKGDPSGNSPLRDTVDRVTDSFLVVVSP